MRGRWVRKPERLQHPNFLLAHTTGVRTAVGVNCIYFKNCIFSLFVVVGLAVGRGGRFNVEPVVPLEEVSHTVQSRLCQSLGRRPPCSHPRRRRRTLPLPRYICMVKRD